MKKRSFTLIEIVIAMPLVALIFSSLLLTLFQALKNDRLLEKREKAALTNHYFQRRLQKKLFLFDKEQKLNKEHFQKETFTFYFHNGISLNSEASGKLKALIHLKNKTLILSLFKERGKESYLVRQEELLKEVSSLSFDYDFEVKDSVKRFQLKKLGDLSSFDKAEFVAFTLNVNNKPYFFHRQRSGS